MSCNRRWAFFTLSSRPRDVRTMSESSGFHLVDDSTRSTSSQSNKESSEGLAECQHSPFHVLKLANQSRNVCASSLLLCLPCAKTFLCIENVSYDLIKDGKPADVHCWKDLSFWGLQGESIGVLRVMQAGWHRPHVGLGGLQPWGWHVFSSNASSKGVPRR